LNGFVVNDFVPLIPGGPFLCKYAAEKEAIPIIQVKKLD
jgi:hypothetical protein